MADGTPQFARPPPAISDALKVSFPAAHVVLLTLNRPAARNAMSPGLQADIERTLAWFDDEPSLWVGILTGAGRVFCAGADLKAWAQASGKLESERSAHSPAGIAASTHGFAGVSRRTASCKPLIAAVVGGAFGGGVEMLLNCDLVVAADDATFALPEVKVGVTVASGGIPRLVSIAGRQLASEMMLLGRTVTAQEACSRFRLCREPARAGERVLATALEWARAMTRDCSPDAVQSTKRGIALAWQHGSVEDATVAHARAAESVRHFAGDNIKEGLRAFAEKRKPKWTNPAKL
ncbi:ClpP/crotonase [Phellopilus nigrolimitatus]|nr:ClpP/crotonase [Phellopilus nigrolimitatus]